MLHGVFILNASHAAQYEELLKRAYAFAEGFVVRSAGLRWTVAGTVYPTLGIYDHGNLISVMRVETVLNQAELDYKIGSHVDTSQYCFPAMYLTKAATWPGLKEKGYNSLLRYHSLKLAEQWGIRYIFGTMVENSPRVFTMQEMGYTFYKVDQKWSGNFISDRHPLVAVLDMKQHAERAFSLLEEKIKDLHTQYPLQFDFAAVPLPDVSGHAWPWLQKMKQA
jgi:hypothetical protein